MLQGLCVPCFTCMDRLFYNAVGMQRWRTSYVLFDLRMIALSFGGCAEALGLILRDVGLTQSHNSHKNVDTCCRFPPLLQLCFS